MELLYRAGRDHGNADGMSRLPELCMGYKTGVKIEELPCGGCRFWGGRSRTGRVAGELY